MNESQRVVLLTPAGRDAAMAEEVLRKAGIEARGFQSMDQICAAIGGGAGALLLTEEGLAGSSANDLIALLEGQEPWSDLPLVVLTSNRLSTYPQVEALRRLGSACSVTFLERPVRQMTLISTLRSALQARRRQYQLRDMIARLGRDLDNRDEFLALLGHELRNPLGAIRNSVEVLRLGDAVSTEGTDFALATLDRQLHHVTRLVDDLLDISRVTRGRLRLKRRPLDLREVLEQSVQNARSEFAAHDVELRVAPVDAPLPVEGDEVRLVQALSNLLGNAARYTPAGGRVELSAHVEDGAVELRVRDTGVGLARAMLERVFEPFVRGERGEPGQDGLGVGLTLARRVAEMHGGRLWAESEGEGRGSEFRLRLPRLANGALGRSDRASEAGDAPDVPRRVLIVEDHAEQARSLGLVIGSMGHQVRIAHRGLEALALADEWRPEVVLLDLDLPDVDGCEVARRLRDDPAQHPMLVALSGFGLELDRLRTRRAGCVEHLTKPVTPPQLRRIFRRAGAGAGAGAG